MISSSPLRRPDHAMRPDATYQLLRHLTSPVVALPSSREVLDSAVRASIVPTVPRVSIYVHKFNFSHDMIFATGAFVLHLLRTDQFTLIRKLGFVSGRNHDKLADLAHHAGTTGLPVLDDCYAHFECKVINVMDTGSSTCFLGDVVAVGHGSAAAPAGEVMTAGYFRAHMPPEWRGDYEALLKAAQQFAEKRSREIKSSYSPRA